MDASPPAEDGPTSAARTAPRVQAVVVAHEPGPWFDETLASLDLQDYPRLGVTVLAAGGEATVRHFVSERLPDAEVVSVDERHGFGRSANTVLDGDDRPAFYLFCHDDVALAPDAVRLLVEESLRSNASIVGPKLVDWSNPNELLEVGFDVDKLGHMASRIEPGELDQEQHDAVVDVFGVSAATVLVRADLFEALDGFDAAMGVTGEDLDLCWRAHVAGARVMVVPSAVVRHREGMRTRRTNLAVERVRERHRLRAVLSNYGVWHTLRVLPQAIFFTLLRAFASVLTGRFGRAGGFFGAWFWNLRHPTSLLKRRRALRRLRKLPDGDVRKLQLGGFAPLSAFLRGQLAPDHVAGSMSVRARDLVLSLRSGPSRVSLGFWAVALAVLGFGSRHLLTRRVPAVGDLVPFDLDVGQQFSAWYDSWWSTGTGHEGAAPTAHALVGALGVVFLGAMGLLRTVLTVGMIPLGALGVWRLLRPFDSPWIRVVGSAMYLASPVAFNALAAGSWGGLVLYGAAPWLLALLGRAGQLAPFGERGGLAGPGVYTPSLLRESLGLGLVLALVVAVVPFGAAVMVTMALAVAVGSLLAGWPSGVRRLGAVTGLGLVVAGVLHLPWLVDAFVAGARWEWFAGTRPPDVAGVDLVDALRLETGPIGGAPLGWALPLAAAAPLFLARGDRWAWAVRGWVLYLAGVAAVWADSQQWTDLAGPRPEVVLAPAALGLAVAAAMGVAAIQRDLRSYKFGWRQLVPLAAIMGAVLAIFPVATASWAGDWDMPDTQLNRPLASVEAGPPGTTRVLWIGHDDVLAAAGHRFDDELTVAVSGGPVSTFADRFAGVPERGDTLVDEALGLAIDGGTSRLGRLLAPLGITEIIVVERSAPPPSTAIERPVDERVLAALSEQLDLQEVQIVPGVTNYRVTDGFGVANAVAAGVTDSTDLRSFVAAPGVIPARPLTAAVDGTPTYTGPVATGEEVFVAVPGDAAWRLTVDGRVATKGPALDWAVAFRPAAGGEAVLAHRTSTGHHIVLLLQAALWILAVLAVVRLSAQSRELPA